jgi:hypothetical protein
MNIEKIRSKKALKFLGLLISALLIATVSAQLYNYMYIQGSATAVTGKGLVWELGADAPTSPIPTIDGPTVSNLALTTDAGNPRDYPDCLHLVNLDAAPTSHAFSIKVTGTSASADFTTLNLRLFDELDGEQAVLDLKTLNDEVTGLTISGGVTWRVMFELIPISSPSGTAVNFEVTLTYESAA